MEQREAPNEQRESELFASHVLEHPFIRTLLTREAGHESASTPETTHIHAEAVPVPLLEQINTQHYAEVKTHIERPTVEAAVTDFRAFTELPEETKRSLSIPGENGRGKGALGFVERKPDTDEQEKALGKEPEHKLYFHYHPSVEDKLSSQIEAAGPAVQEMILKLRALWITMEADAYNALTQLQAENANNPHYAGMLEKFFPDGLTHGEPGLRHPKLTLRIMLYMKIGDGGLNANNHYDGGGFTFAVCESQPGLQVGTQAEHAADGTEAKPEDMHEVSRPDGTALMWTGVNFKNIDPEQEPTWHGVKQHTTEEVGLGEENRWVCVFFLDEYDEKAPTIEETHGVKKN